MFNKEAHHHPTGPVFPLQVDNQYLVICRTPLFFQLIYFWTPGKPDKNLERLQTSSFCIQALI